MFQLTNDTNFIQESPNSYFKVLIVEDARVINNALSKNLQSEGYTCFQAFKLQEALDVLQQHEVDLIILDLHLPDGDGEDLIVEVQEYNKKAKIVIFTSDNDLSRRDELFRLGILDYILKGKNANIIIKDIFNIIHNIQINPHYTILIIDDSAVIRRMIKRILAPANYQLLEAKNGIDALEIIQKNKIDLALLDMEMGEMNGMEVLKSIKQTEANFHLPVFIISSNLDIEIMRNAYKEGALDYFKKPFSPEELKLKVEQVIKQKQNEHDLQNSLEVSNILKNFLNEFYANAIFYTNTRKKWSDKKFDEYFEKRSDNLIQLFNNFEKDLVTDFIINIKAKKSFQSQGKNEKGETFNFKLFPLQDEEFLLCVEKL
jgi:DNA-binding response OmpR family regulator